MSPKRQQGLEATKRAVSYLRVSTQQQVDKDYDPQGFSIPTQHQLNLRKAAELGATVVEEFVDGGGSGRNINRKELQRMLSYLKEEGNIDYVIVSYIDRFARRLRDHVVIKLAIEQTGAKLVSATENIDDSDAGQLIEGVLAVVAEFQSNHNVGKVKNGLQRKAETGGTPGRAPIGYVNVFENFEGRRIRIVRIDPERGPLVRWAFEAYANGEWTTTRLTDALSSQGLRSIPTARTGPRPLSVSTVAYLLSNPYYLGYVIHKGDRYPGRHKPLVDQATFDKVQDVLESHSCGEKQVKHRRYLTSSLYCGYCGSRLCFSRNKGNGGVYEYWLCVGRQKGRAECPQRMIADDDVEAAVVRYWRRVLLPDEKIEELRQGIDRYMDGIRQSGAEKIEEMKRHIGRLKTQEKELLALRYADSISRDLFSEEQRRIASEVGSAESEIVRYELANVDVAKLYSQAAELLRNFPTMYEASTPSARRRCNQTVFERIYLQGPSITGARLTKIAAGLLEPVTGSTIWGKVPGEEGDEPDGGDDPSERMPDTILICRGLRERDLVRSSPLGLTWG
jgi:site-specific DNA recombinase